MTTKKATVENPAPSRARAFSMKQMGKLSGSCLANESGSHERISKARQGPRGVWKLAPTFHKNFLRGRSSCIDALTITYKPRVSLRHLAHACSSTESAFDQEFNSLSAIDHSS